MSSQKLADILLGEEGSCCKLTILRGEKLMAVEAERRTKEERKRNSNKSISSDDGNSSPNRTAHSCFGFTVKQARGSEEWQVSSLKPNMPRENQEKVAPGDVIISIDGSSCGGRDPKGMQGMLRGPSRSEAEVELRRGGKIDRVKLRRNG
ncbi:hypothetical protein GUITHDRAFT_153937 [Guillardia theta CCMP2712]|uniref:PDZ domain-containing protein n=2 Tax=Guillardia theta TaxID=55529 RepID=L1IY27_GUITC|nr:hypothetical protein GUITHDRAFT_153937 [Guillardia theta CCMP2712]EKX41146.1 hypothetical protein GUITHDRAFT_153937 [Guillardia theta CCMP2712]|eukprot:XP_005828126.1 hypothetical protein GUITHDRAFT_153937 [Guillardia theta CCMP2712]